MRAMETPMENRIINTPTELDDRDLDLVSGGGGSESGGALVFAPSRGNTSGGLLGLGVLNGNSVNLLGTSTF
jgi:hypothetical protein